MAMQARRRMKAKGPKGREKGVELVEMAFVLPLLLVLLLGIIYFGRAYDIYQTITRAAREGARQAVLTGCATCSDPTSVPASATIQSNYVNPALQAANLDPTNSLYTGSYHETYVWLDSPTNSICGIEIDFQYPYRIELPFTGLRTTIDIPTRVQMRLETQTAAECTALVGTSP
jgi:TadE-like protein